MNAPKLTPYKDALTRSMNYLAQFDNTIFIGQQIVFAGNPMSTTLLEIDKGKMIELPVMEETQMGFGLGLSCTGYHVISFYPRWDFIISASNQLINHVDKFEIMTGKKPNLIVRLGKGSDKPLDPGHQHKGNYLNEFRSLCKNISFHNLDNTADIFEIYKNCYHQGGVHVLVEYPELYYA